MTEAAWMTGANISRLLAILIDNKYEVVKTVSQHETEKETVG
jgi:hypothetical protein